MASKGGGSSQIVGYRYYMSVHMGVSRGPVNEITALKVGDLLVFEGSITDNNMFAIDKPDLFGGDDKEGGIKGTIATLFGAADQTIPSIILDNLPGLRPAWRGVTSLFYYGQVSSNNPYPKPWKIRVNRTTAGWDGTPWYAEKCLVLLNNLPLSVLIFTANPAPGDSVTIGGIAIHFNTSPIADIDVIIGGDAVATAAAFADIVNFNSGSLFDVTAVANGNVVELRVSHDSMPTVTQIGSVTISSAGGDIKAMNPAHMIYECATNRVWGRGLPAAKLDDDSFRAAADTLFDEGFGLCMRWNREDDIDKFVGTIVQHIGASVYIDRSTGLLTLKLIRNDYDIDGLAVFDFNSGLLDILEDQSSATDTSYNEVVVTYHDPITDMDGQVRVQDLASIQSLGVTISTSVDYMGIPTPDLALRLAQRDLESQSRELRRLTLKLDRAGWNIPPGGVFKVRAPSRGIREMVLRAGRVEDSPLTDGGIKITAIEDVFSLPATSFIGVENDGWIPPDRTAHVVSVRRIEEMIYRDLAANLTAADLATVEPDSGAIKVLAKRPTPGSNDYIIASKIGAEAWVERGVNSWEPVFSLLSSIGHYTTAITFSVNSSLIEFTSGIEIGSAVLIDDEYMRLDAIDTAAGTATVARGVADTIPSPHAVNSNGVWFEDAQPAGDGREYSTGEEVSVRLLTRTSSNKLALADAPIDVIEIGGRQGRPYPPGNFKINGTPFANVNNNSTSGADVVFTWAHRDRITQGNFLLEHEAAGTGPETGVTYTIRVYDGATLLRTTTGITGETWTYTNAMFIADGEISRLTFELESVRSAYVSWQKYAWTIFVGEVTLTIPSLFTETDVFFSPTVTAGGVVVLPGLVTEADTFYAPDLVGRNVYPLVVIEFDEIYPPIATVGTAILSPPLLTEADAFFTFSVIAPSILSAPLFIEADTFFSPVMIGGEFDQTVLPSLVTESDTFYGPTVANLNQSIFPPLVTESDTIYVPAGGIGASAIAQYGIPGGDFNDTGSGEHALPGVGDI